jgi:hypothetical protein
MAPATLCYWDIRGLAQPARFIQLYYYLLLIDSTFNAEISINVYSVHKNICSYLKLVPLNYF